MEKAISKVLEFKKYYFSEIEFFDGDECITFNIVGISATKNTVAVAVSDRGKIRIIDFELMTDEDGYLYFEYGCTFRKSISTTLWRYDYETYISQRQRP